MLQKAVVSQKSEEYYLINNLWIEFSNGQVVKLQMFKSDDKFAFLDIKTNKFYEVNDREAISAFTDFNFKKLDFNFLVFLVWIGFIWLGAWVAESRSLEIPYSKRAEVCK